MSEVRRRNRLGSEMRGARMKQNGVKCAEECARKNLMSELPGCAEETQSRSDYSAECAEEHNGVTRKCAEETEWSAVRGRSRISAPKRGGGPRWGGGNTRGRGIPTPATTGGCGQPWVLKISNHSTFLRLQLSR